MTVQPLPGQITSKDIADFLQAQGFPTFASRDGKLPPMPNKVVVITQYGGPGFSEDGVFDNVSYQMRCRGGQNNPLSAEQMAWDLDGLLVPPPASRPLAPGLVGSQFVSRVTRAGGPPSFLLLDTSRRTHFVCSYTFKVARIATTV